MADRTRNLLHRSKLEEFKQWAVGQGYREDTGSGLYQVLRLRPPEGSGMIVFYERDSGKHVTSHDEGTSLVRRWLREREKAVS
jgi:hypothetical protein